MREVRKQIPLQALQGNADAKFRSDALENAESVIAEWLETARELGRRIPEPKGRLLDA